MTKPDVVMFMSVDLAGSTAFKLQAPGDSESPAWLEAFEAFFREAPLIMMGQIAAAFALEDEVPHTVVWKVIGDEIVFMAHPKTPREAQLLTIAYYRTTVRCDQKILERWPLRIKGCCWAAQVSHRNREIEIPEMMGADANHVYVDYLGPDVDAGFRLASYVGQGQMVVATNLVQLLAGMDEQESVRFHFLGNKVLKGVYHGRPYPLFLMTMADQPGNSEAMEPASILELLEESSEQLNPTSRTGIEWLKF